MRAGYACRYKSLRSRIWIEPIFRVHSYIPIQKFRFAGSTLPLPAGRRDRDTLFFGCLQHRLAAADHARLIRSNELDYGTRRSNWDLWKALRNCAAETFLPDSFRLHSEASEDRAAAASRGSSWSLCVLTNCSIKGFDMGWR